MKVSGNNEQKGERGFTLVETSISMVVMMVAGLAMSSLFVFSMQNNVGGGNETSLAMAVAQQQLEQLRSVTFEDTTMTVERPPPPSAMAIKITASWTITDETNADGSSKQLRKISTTVTVSGTHGTWTRTPITLVSYRSTLASGSFAVQ